MSDFVAAFITTVFFGSWIGWIYYKRRASITIMVGGGFIAAILATLVVFASVSIFKSKPKVTAQATPAAPREALPWCQYSASRNRIYDEVQRKWDAAHPHQFDTDAEDKQMAKQRAPMLKAERNRLFGNISDKDFQLLDARAIRGGWYQKYCVAKQSEEAWVPVTNSAWDGSVWQVKTWIKNNLNDAESFHAVEWSPVVKIANGYLVRCKFRAKNAYGAYILKNAFFRLDRKGNVVDVSGFS